MATGVGREKMRLAAFDGPSPKTPLKAQKSCKNLLRKPSYSPFWPKFRCHGNGGRSGKNEIGSIRWPTPENLPIGAKISYARRVIAHFVTNFVAMATGVGWEKCDWQHSMAHPWKPPYRRKNFAKISYASRVIANFVPNFVAMATGVGREKCNWQHSIAHPRKPPYRRKNIAKISYTSRVCPKFRCHGNQGKGKGTGKENGEEKG